MQLRAASLAPHLSPRERAALDARTLAKVRAIAPAPAPDETPVAPVREWYFSAHLSPREQRIKRALNVSRRKGAARAEFARDIQTRAALARALCGVSREVARGALARFARARFARARALQREREATRGACAVAGQRARFHTHGALVVRERATGKRIGRKAARALAPASGAECFNARDSRAEILRGEFVLDARAGTGVPVEWQGVCEMRLAARAELLAGNGWKAANTSAARELNRVLKEPALSSVEKAARAADRRFALSRELWESAESDECAESDEQPQPHFAECLAESDEESEVSPLVLVFAKRKRAAQYLRAYWRAKKSPAARSLHARDLHTLREHSRAAIQGVRALVAFSVHRAISADEKAAKCAAQKAFRVGERVMEGKEMLAASAREVREVREVRAGIPRRAPVATLTIPRTRAEWFEIDAPALALRLLAKLHARTAHGSAAQSARRAGKAANARAEKAREVRAMRATLPAPALAALAEWQPSAGK